MHTNMKTHLPTIIALFSIWLLLVVATSCNKDNFLKNPTHISFSLEMDSEAMNGMNQMTFDSATVVLSSFTVIGDRAWAEDYEFTRTFPTGLSIDLEKANALSELQFDLPQGKYQKVTLLFETSQVYVQGLCVNPQKLVSTVHFKLDKPKQFEMDITDTLGNIYLDFKESVAENPKIIFKPKSWFELVPETVFENAYVFYVGNNREIYIGTNENPLIFDIIDQYIVPNTKCILHP